MSENCFQTSSELNWQLWERWYSLTFCSYPCMWAHTHTHTQAILPVHCRVIKRPSVLRIQVAIRCRSSNNTNLEQHPKILMKKIWRQYRFLPLSWRCNYTNASIIWPLWYCKIWIYKHQAREVTSLQFHMIL